MDSGEVLEFWNNYSWNWKTPADVQEFIETAIEQGMYEDSVEIMGLDENWYTNWWLPAQDAIKRMISTFNEEDLSESVRYLLEPFEDYYTIDFAIYDAILKFLPGFPSEWSEYENSLDKYYENSCEFSWLTTEGRYFTWTFYGPESIAKSKWISRNFLRRVFINSIWLSDYNSIQQAFRVRLAFAMNPNSPVEILNFLWDERNSGNWMATEDDLDEDSEISILDISETRIVLNPDSEFFETTRERIDEMEDLSHQIFGNDLELRGAAFLDTLFDIPMEGRTARECLFAAFAKNPNLSEHQYEEIAQEESDFVRYMLSKNPAVPRTLAVQLALEGCTFTFTPHSGNDNDPITLN
jgi:hypothetical protein